MLPAGCRSSSRSSVETNGFSRSSSRSNGREVYLLEVSMLWPCIELMGSLSLLSVALKNNLLVFIGVGLEYGSNEKVFFGLLWS